MSTPAEVVAALSTLVESEELRPDEAASLHGPTHALVIICPDCGKWIAFRGRCPKCGGVSWFPAGAQGGYDERMRLHRLITAED